MAFPTFDVSYTLEVAAEPGGVRVSINLEKPLPPQLVGRAGFNLEFLPSIYMGKTYLVDGSHAGLFPRTPNDPMIKVMPLPGEHASDFLAAKLIYKSLGYIFCRE